MQRCTINCCCFFFFKCVLIGVCEGQIIRILAWIHFLGQNIDSVDLRGLNKETHFPLLSELQYGGSKGLTLLGAKGHTLSRSLHPGGQIVDHPSSIRPHGVPWYLAMLYLIWTPVISVKTSLGSNKRLEFLPGLVGTIKYCF